MLYYSENYFFMLQTSSVVVSCHDHFKISGINRNEEITAVEEQINILEDEVLFTIRYYCFSFNSHLFMF